VTEAGPIVALYDRGAVGPRELVAGLRPLGPVWVVVAQTPEGRAALPVLRAGADRVLVDDSPERTDAILAGAGARGVVTFSERCVLRRAGLAVHLALEAAAAREPVLVDKALQGERLAAAGLPTPRRTEVASAEDWPAALEHAGLPAVVKPVTGEGSRGVVRLDHAASCSSVAPSVGPFPWLVEQLWFGEDLPPPYAGYVSVEAMVVDEDVRPLAVTGKLRLVPPFRETGQCWPAPIDSETHDTVVEVAVRAARALGPHRGLTHTEIILTPDGPRVVEVNGRCGGNQAELARLTSGVDLVTVAGTLSSGAFPELAGLLSDRGDDVIVQWMTPAPPEPFVLRGARGHQDPDPAVVSARCTQPFDTEVVPGVQTSPLDLVTFRVARHEDAAEVLAAIRDRLFFDLETRSGRRWWSAAELAAAETPRTA